MNNKLQSEFVNYAQAREIHNLNLDFPAFGFYNLNDDGKITLDRNATSLRSIVAPLHQQYKRLKNL